MSINYKCVLNNYTDITQVNICIVDVFNNQSIYPMTKENAYTFVLTETIPLVNYANFEILVKNGDKGEKINADSEIEHHLDNLLSHLIYIYIPGDKNYKLIRNNMIYELDYSYLENEKIDYSGTLSNKVEIIINKIKNNNYEKIGQTNTTLDKQKKIKLSKDLSNGSEINVIVNIITAEQSYELVNINRYVQTGGISYSEYPIYRY
ncbi:hypothetical protein [Thomasclavelia sp.]|uniref:hypothetical protein n=1 Tax=Thomasclavelia sp. TaxID=3025757 RepID=UPI0025795F9C|nr:hypothetical protein [Thomasclavelia sp.]